jgi:hypothetical protein
MDDADEELIIKQAIYSQMKFISAKSNFLKSVIRPEIIFFASLLFLFCFYLQAIELNATGFITRITNTFKFKASSTASSFTISLDPHEKIDQLVAQQSAAFSVRGRRMTQEDR